MGIKIQIWKERLMNNSAITSATRQVRQQWFSVCIFPLSPFFGLTGNRPQSAPACSFLRYRKPYWRQCGHKQTE